MSKNLESKIYLLVFYWLPFLLWAMVIFSFSASHEITASTVHWQDFIIKKAAHMTEYFIFSLLFYRALVNSKVDSKKALMYVILLAFFYGLSDEFHQSYTPGRDPTLRDALIDTFGSIVFSFSMFYIIPKSKQLTKLAEMIQLVRSKS